MEVFRLLTCIFRNLLLVIIALTVQSEVIYVVIPYRYILSHIFITYSIALD